MPVGPDATTGEDSDDEDDDQFVGGFIFIDLGNQERPEVEQLRQGAAEVAGGRRYEQTVVSPNCISILYKKKKQSFEDPRTSGGLCRPFRSDPWIHDNGISISIS